LACGDLPIEQIEIQICPEIIRTSFCYRKSRPECLDFGANEVLTGSPTIEEENPWELARAIRRVMA